MVETIVRLARAKKVDGVEACCATNTVAQARIETLRAPARFGPGTQQLVQFATADAGVKVVVNGSYGSSATTVLTANGLETAVERAILSAKTSLRDPQFRSLPKGSKAKPKKLPLDKKVHEGEMQETLGEAAAEALALVSDPEMDLAGTLLAFGTTVSYQSSEGAEVWENRDTGCAALLTAERVEGPSAVGSGVGFSAARRWKEMDVTGAAREAIELAAVEPVHQKVEPGDYSVLLGEYAWADILDNMFAYSFTLSAAYRGTTWLPVERPETGLPRFSKAKLAPESITFRDEPNLENGLLSTAVDDEGQPTKPVVLLDKGRFGPERAFDTTYYDYLYEHAVHGRGLRRGDVPGRSGSASAESRLTNLTQRPGDMSLEELVEQVEATGKPALYIPRTWYTYPARIGSPQFSSSNRATSFLVKGRELIPVRPNAFKLSGNILEMLKSVRGVARTRKQVTTWGANGSYLVPKIACEGVRVERLP